eukprot:349652_1
MATESPQAHDAPPGYNPTYDPNAPPTYKAVAPAAQPQVVYQQPIPAPQAQPQPQQVVYVQSGEPVAAPVTAPHIQMAVASHTENKSNPAFADTLDPYTEKSTPCLTFVIVLSQLLMLLLSVISALYVNDLMPTYSMTEPEKSTERGNAILYSVLVEFLLSFLRSHLWAVRYRQRNETVDFEAKFGCAKLCGCAKFQKNSIYTRETVRKIICFIDIFFDFVAGIIIRYGVQFSEEDVSVYMSLFGLEGLNSYENYFFLLQIGTWLGCSDEFIEFSMELLLKCVEECLETCYPVLMTCISSLIALFQMIISFYHAQTQLEIINEILGLIETIGNYNRPEQEKYEISQTIYSFVVFVSVSLSIYVFVMIIFLLKLKCRGR